MTNPIVTTERQIRELLQPMLKDAQMQSWREGVQVGLRLAHGMAEVKRNECALKFDADCTIEERAALGDQIAAIGDLMTALTTAADDVPNLTSDGLTSSAHLRRQQPPSRAPHADVPLA